MSAMRALAAIMCICVVGCFTAACSGSTDMAPAEPVPQFATHSTASDVFSARIVGELAIEGRCLMLKDSAWTMSAVSFPDDAIWDESAQALLVGSHSVQIGDVIHAGGGFNISTRWLDPIPEECIEAGVFDSIGAEPGHPGRAVAMIFEIAEVLPAD